MQLDMSSPPTPLRPIITQKKNTKRADILPPTLPRVAPLGNLLIHKQLGGRRTNTMNDFRVPMNNWKRTHLQRKLPPQLRRRDGINTWQRHQVPIIGPPMAHTNNMTRTALLPPSNLF